jgi:hypothetical protein
MAVWYAKKPRELRGESGGGLGDDGGDRDRPWSWDVALFQCRDLPWFLWVGRRRVTQTWWRVRALLFEAGLNNKADLIGNLFRPP